MNDMAFDTNERIFSVMLSHGASSLPGLTELMGRDIPQLWWGFQAPMKLKSQGNVLNYWFEVCACVCGVCGLVMVCQCWTGYRVCEPGSVLLNQLVYRKWGRRWYLRTWSISSPYYVTEFSCACVCERSDLRCILFPGHTQNQSQAPLCKQP